MWIDAAAGVAFGHRRLAVLDLSKAGAQPMESRSGRYVLTFNGEIYNYNRLRSELHDVRFAGASDTEVLLYAIEEWGIQTALRRSVGMFAFGLWDRQQNELVLARDRIGEKPLYWGWVRGHLVFASELRALRFLPGMNHQISNRALQSFFRLGYVPAPLSILEGVMKLPPASYLSWSPQADAEPVIRQYWEFPSIEAEGSSTEDSAEAVVDHLEVQLASVISERLHADVPLGAFLSGGVDSSTVVAVTRRCLGREVKTFSIGFPDQNYDEAPAARAVARHLACDHLELYLSDDDLLGVVPRLSHVYDEPFADTSQIPTLLLSEFARREVTVALSGDGGDELFGGYTRYARLESRWRRRRLVPDRICQHLASGFLALERLNSITQATGGAGVNEDLWIRMARNLSVASRFFGATTPEAMFDEMVALWARPEALCQQAAAPLVTQRAPSGGRLRAMAQRADAVRYLPDDILVKVDRASMAHSLETRLPFLDHHLIESVWGLPASVKSHGVETKWPLRQLLRRHIPAELIDRPKKGFDVPIDTWLRGPLRDWADELLCPVLAGETQVDGSIVGRMWDAHTRGDSAWGHHLWSVLMFEGWRADRPGERSPTW